MRCSQCLFCFVCVCVWSALQVNYCRVVLSKRAGSFVERWNIIKFVRKQSDERSYFNNRTIYPETAAILLVLLYHILVVLSTSLFITSRTGRIWAYSTFSQTNLKNLQLCWSSSRTRASTCIHVDTEIAMLKWYAQREARLLSFHYFGVFLLKLYSLFVLSFSFGVLLFGTQALSVSLSPIFLLLVFLFFCFFLAQFRYSINVFLIPSINNQGIAIGCYCLCR